MMINKLRHTFLALAAILSIVSAQHLRNNLEGEELSSCRKGWRRALKGFREAAAKWPSMYCYTFTFETIGFHPLPQGPVDVTVVDGVVVSPVDAHNVPLVPTMEEIFETIYDNCFATCPEAGPNKCQIKYSSDDSLGYPEAVFIDPFKLIKDEEIWYAISNVGQCEL